VTFDDFGMDTASLAGSLEAKLAAVRQAGFSQVMISAADIVGHPHGTAAGVRAVRDSALRVTGLEALRDFEGLTGDLHHYKLDIAKAMLTLCHQIGGRLLLVEASTRPTPAPTLAWWRPTCASSQSSRFPSGSGSRSRGCRGAGR